MSNDCAVNFDHLQTVSKGKIGSDCDFKLEQDATNAAMFALCPWILNFSYPPPVAIA
jgi:hypothetical protein